MGEAAQEDEGAEQHGESAKLEVFPLAQEDPDRQGNGRVGEEDQKVGAGMQRHQPRLPQQAIAVRHVGGLTDHVVKHEGAPKHHFEKGRSHFSRKMMRQQGL